MRASTVAARNPHPCNHRGQFYSRAKISSKAWQLKWVTIDKDGFRSCRDRDFPDKHVHVFNIFQGTKVEQIDEKVDCIGSTPSDHPTTPHHLHHPSPRKPPLRTHTLTPLSGSC